MTMGVGGRGRGERVDNEKERLIHNLYSPGVLPLVAVGGAVASWKTLPNIVHLSLVRAVCETRRDEVSINGKASKGEATCDGDSKSGTKLGKQDFTHAIV